MMFSNLIDRCRRLFGNVRSTPRRSSYTPLAVEVLEDRAVMTVGGLSDLAITDFQLDTGHSSRSKQRIEATVTVTNFGPHKSKAAEVYFYAKQGAFGYVHGDLLLGKFNASRLDPGESVTITRKINDPIYMRDATFTNGYYINAHVDPRNRIAETNDFNNAVGRDACTSFHLTTDVAAVWAIVDGFAFGGVFSVGFAAYTHLTNYLAGTGATVSWQPGSFPSNNLQNGPEFAKSAKNAKKFLESQLVTQVKKTGFYNTSLSVSQRTLGTPSLEDNLDLFYAIHGTQASLGEFSNIRLTSARLEGRNTIYTYDADLFITYYDRYTFDFDDAQKLMGDYVRHLELAGVAKAFDVYITGYQKVQGEISVRR